MGAQQRPFGGGYTRENPASLLPMTQKDKREQEEERCKRRHYTKRARRDATTLGS